MQTSAPLVKIGIAAGLLLAGAIYLTFVRGEAMLLDLSGLLGMICF